MLSGTVVFQSLEKVAGAPGIEPGIAGSNPMPYRLAMPQHRWSVIYASAGQSSSFYQFKKVNQGVIFVGAGHATHP